MAPTPFSNARPGLDAAGRGSRQDDVIIEAVWCYYHDGLDQKKTAKRLNVSRASVVNYLAKAPRHNYVRITLDGDVFRNNQFASDLRQKFGLVDALVVPPDTSSGQRSFERVIRAASDWLPQLLESGDHLGVAWGETIFRLAEIAPTININDLTIVQLLGSKPDEIGFAAENCAATLAQRFGAQCLNLHVALLVSSSELCESLKAEPMIASQLQKIADCKKVIFAFGTVDPDSHMLGLTLAQMRQKEIGIQVSVGLDHVDRARAARRGGYVTHLIACSATAERLLQGTA